MVPFSHQSCSLCDFIQAQVVGFEEKYRFNFITFFFLTVVEDKSNVVLEWKEWACLLNLQPHFRWFGFKIDLYIGLYMLAIKFYLCDRALVYKPSVTNAEWGSKHVT